MRRVFTGDLSRTRIRSIFRAARFGDRTRCPACGYARKLWRLEDVRWRCRRCRERFRLLTTGTPLARESFSLAEVYELLFWFELGFTDHGIARRQPDVSYDRIHHFLLKLRRAIHDCEERSSRVLEGKVKVDETYFRPAFGNRRRAERQKLRKAGKVRRGRAARELQQPAFGIYEQTDGLVYVDQVADVSGAQLKKVLRETVAIQTTVYSNSFASYRGLEEEFAGHETVSYRSGEYARGAATINGIEGFWAYAKERLLRPHGGADDHFLLHLKEVEYRFNHRELEPEAFVNHLLSEVLLAWG